MCQIHPPNKVNLTVDVAQAAQLYFGTLEHGTACSGTRRPNMSSTPENEGGKQAIPPYLSHKTFNNFLEGLSKGIPSRIDRSVMASLSRTAQAHLLHALKYLNLIDAEGVPTETLNQLATAQGADKQKILKEMLITAYPFVFKGSVDLERCTSKQIEEAFASTGASSETLRKTLSFFLATAKQAGLTLSPHIKRARRPRGTGTRARRSVTSGAGTSTSAGADEVDDYTPPPRPSTKTKWELLLEKFPTFDPAWPDEIKGKWFEAFDKLSHSGDEEE